MKTNYDIYEKNNLKAYHCNQCGYVLVTKDNFDIGKTCPKCNAEIKKFLPYPDTMTLREFCIDNKLRLPKDFKVDE